MNESSTSWLNTMLQMAWQARWPHIDVLCDLAKAGGRPLSALRHLQLETQKLLQGTQHEDAADEGPLLVRYRLSAKPDSDVLASSLATWCAQDSMIILQSQLPFSLLSARLQYFALASWDDGASHGVLRYYTPLLLAPTLNALGEAHKATLLSAASQWYWQDRDGKAQHMLAVDAALAWPVPDTPLLLGDEAVHRLNGWHESELYVQQYLPTPQQTGSDSQEAMMQKVFRAQMAADRAGLYSPQERDAFVARQLCLTPPAAS